MTEVEQGNLVEQGRRHADGQDDAQSLVGVLELALEGRAAPAGPQMAADERAGTLGQALGHLGQLDPNVLAGQLAGLGRLGQRDPSPNEQ
jgi:hypothetical protein